MEFREKCPEIAGTDLWKIFEKKAGDDHEFIAAVGEICYEGVLLSKDVMPNGRLPVRSSAFAHTSDP